VSDLYFTASGDLVIDGNKDIGRVANSLRNDIQQVYLRLMTEPGDFYIYPDIGVDLSMLYGMPQIPSTGEFGKRLIYAALQREGLFKGREIKINAIPVSKDTLRFDIHIISDIDQPIVISITQGLN
jgi:hypothetical protein